MYSFVLTPGMRLVILIAALCLAIGTFQSTKAQLGRPMQDELLIELPKMEARLATPSTRRTLSSAQWANYGDRIERALASDHEGLRQGALRMIIQYGPSLRLNRQATIDAVRIYRNHSNDRIRRMAVVALGRLQEPWSMDFLRRSLKFEREPEVRHTIAAVVARYHESRPGDIEVGEPERVR